MKDLIEAVIKKEEKVYKNKLEEAIIKAEELQVNPIKNTKLMASYVMALWNIPTNEDRIIELIDSLEEIILSNYSEKTSFGYLFKSNKKILKKSKKTESYKFTLSTNSFHEIVEDDMEVSMENSVYSYDFLEFQYYGKNFTVFSYDSCWIYMLGKILKDSIEIDNVTEPKIIFDSLDDIYFMDYELRVTIIPQQKFNWIELIIENGSANHEEFYKRVSLTKEEVEVLIKLIDEFYQEKIKIAKIQYNKQ